ncbi:MAG: hypothetical protein D6696_12060, partial [Acidobacteria bacterium]
MSSEEAVERVLQALAVELRATRRIGEIEAQVERSRGYFSKVAGRKWRISLDLLMKTLEILQIEPAVFFARALAPPGDEPREPETRDAGTVVGSTLPRRPSWP